MICSSSKYNEKGELTYRITAGEKVFPEILEIEYNEYGMVQQSLYDLVTSANGTDEDDNGEKKEFKKLKLRSEIIYNDDGKVSKIVTPESIAQFEYTETPVEVPTFKGASFKSKSIARTEYLLKNDDGSDRPDTVCYIVDYSGSFKVDILTINYDSIRILKSYKKGTKSLLFTEYYFFNKKNNVYYEMLDRYDNVEIRQSEEFDEFNRPVYICTEYYNNSQTTILKYEYISKEELLGEETVGDSLNIDYFNYCKRVVDMETEDEIYKEEAVVSAKQVEKDGKLFTVITNSVTEYDIENNEETQDVTSEFTYDDKGRLVKLVDDAAKTTTYNTYPYDDEDEVSRYKVIHREAKRINPFVPNNKKVTGKNEEIHLLAYMVFEEKVITLQLTKYSNGFITKSVKITVEDKEIARYLTNNGEDPSVGILYDALYETYNFSK